ncbi:MAG: PKD domain-containing protein [Candidatus Thermoplasmatota archaeon]|nr:PKD domain-containing protein [Candidatus Thermoplasmatota archaeon]
MISKQWIGIMTATLMVLTAVMAVVPMDAQANEKTNPTIFGLVGISPDAGVSSIEGHDTYEEAGSFTVNLYKAFDLYETSPFKTTTTISGGFYSFQVPPGYYKIGIQSKTVDNVFYHVNDLLVIYDEDGMITLPKLDYDGNEKQDIPLGSAQVKSHFHGIISEGGSPVSGAVVEFSQPSKGFIASATTDVAGEYKSNVFTGTFRMTVKVGGVTRYYGSATANIAAQNPEVFNLPHTPYGAVTVKVDGATYTDHSLVGQTLSVNNVANGKRISVSYSWINNVNESKGTFVEKAPPTQVTLEKTVHNGANGILAVGFSNATETWVPVNWTYWAAQKRLNVTDYVNGTLRVRYNFVDTHTMSDRFVGRNIKDQIITGVRVAGICYNEDTGMTLEGKDINVILYNTATENVYRKTSVGPTFSIKVPSATYVLMVYVEGYEPYTNTNLVVGATAVEVGGIMIKPITSQFAIQTDIIFNGDWNHLTIAKTITMNAYDTFPGMEPNFNNIRFEMDGNKDGALTLAEANAYATMLKTKGPEFLSTEDLFYFNGTAFGSNDTTYDVRIEVPGLNTTSPTQNVGTTTPVQFIFTMNYTSNADIEAGLEQYPSRLKFPAKTGTYRIFLLQHYARSDFPETNNPVAEGEVYVLIDSSTYTTAGDVSMYIRRISEPVPRFTPSVASPAKLVTKTVGAEYYIKAGTSVTFNAGASSVADGNIVGYRWNFGDGTPTTDWLTTPTTTHNFTTNHQAGRTVTLWVKDTAGQINTTTMLIRPDGQAPIPSLATNKTLVAGELWIGQNQNVQFNASASTDGISEYANLTFSWKFGDGAVSSQAVPTHSYALNGTYTVTLNVTDQVGNIGTQTLTVHVNDTMKPVAQFTQSNANPQENSVVRFDASASYDNEGSVVRYIWEWGDGTTDTTTNPVINHTFTDVRVYKVNLTVVDEAGNEGKLSRDISVQWGPRPDIEVKAIEVVGGATNGQQVTVRVTIQNSGTVNATQPITVTLKDGGEVVGTTTIGALAAGASGNATFTWTPSASGNSILTAEASSGEESDRTTHDNSLSRTIRVEPNAMESYGTTIIVLVIIVLLLVLLFGRDKLKGMIPSGKQPVEKKEKRD